MVGTGAYRHDPYEQTAVTSMRSSAAPPQSVPQQPHASYEYPQPTNTGVEYTMQATEAVQTPSDYYYNTPSSGWSAEAASVAARAEVAAEQARLAVVEEEAGRLRAELRAAELRAASLRGMMQQPNPCNHRPSLPSRVVVVRTAPNPAPQIVVRRHAAVIDPNPYVRHWGPADRGHCFEYAPPPSFTPPPLSRCPSEHGEIASSHGLTCDAESGGYVAPDEFTWSHSPADGLHSSSDHQPELLTSGDMSSSTDNSETASMVPPPPHHHHAVLPQPPQPAIVEDDDEDEQPEDGEMSGNTSPRPERSRRAARWELCVQFRHGRCAAHSHTESLPPGTHVLVDGDRGRDLGVVSTAEEVPRRRGRGGRRPTVVRVATDEEVKRWHEQLPVDEETARQWAESQALRRGVRIAVHRADFQFDKKKLTLHYSATGRHPDFRPLLRDGFRRFKCRIWMNNCAPKGAEPGERIDVPGEHAMRCAAA